MSMAVTMVRAITMSMSMVTMVSMVTIMVANTSAGDADVVGSSGSGSNMLGNIVHFQLAVSVTVVVIADRKRIFQI
jgi:hypothetical protein